MAPLTEATGSLAETAEKRQTSYDEGIAATSRLLMRLMAVMLPAVFVISGITKGDWLDALLFSLSVAVGLTPEMLPMLVTSCLAKGAVDLSHDKVIVKRLDAIQDLGAINVLCTEGFISLDELTERLRYRKLSDQYSFHTERACRLLTNEGPL